MSIAPTHNPYQDTSVLSSSPERLVQILYEHLVVNLKRAEMFIHKGDIEGKFECLARASDIVSELLAALDHEAGGEFAERLASLYAFWLSEISTAGRELNTARIQRVIGMVSSLLEAWEEAARKLAPESGNGAMMGETA